MATDHEMMAQPQSFSRLKSFAAIWWITLVIKSLIAIYVPLSNDEAYYWVWGHHPQLSYFDHPPMVGWLFGIGRLFEFYENAVRLPGVWLGHATLLIWNQILAPYLDEKRRTAWLIFICLSPFMGLGSLIITPDVPMVFFWSLSLFLLVRLTEKPSLGLYTLLGLSLGLGFCSKYLIVLFVPIAVIWLAASGEWRKVRWSYLPITVIMGLVACSPVIYWNWKNDWASFAFQLHHGLTGKEPSWNWPLEYASAQVGILFPTVVWFALQRREPKQLHILRYFGWLPLIFFLYTSCKARVEANWPIMAHPALIALAVVNMRSLRWLKVTAGIWFVAMVVVLSQVMHPWIPINPEKLKTTELTQYDMMAPEVAKEPDFYLGSYQMAAAVSFKLKRQVYKLAGLTRRDFYDFLPQSYPNGDRFWFCGYADQSLPQWAIDKGYAVKSSRRLGPEFIILEVERRAKDSDR